MEPNKRVDPHGETEGGRPSVFFQRKKMNAAGLFVGRKKSEKEEQADLRLPCPTTLKERGSERVQATSCVHGKRKSEKKSRSPKKHKEKKLRYRRKSRQPVSKGRKGSTYNTTGGKKDSTITPTTD